MAVPKKKNKKVKLKYSIIKKQYKTNTKTKLMFCIICYKNTKKNKYLGTLNLILKKKICLNCIKKIKK